MEGETRAELEGPHALVSIRLPALGHQPFELVRGAAHQTEQALVDVAEDNGRSIVVLGLGIEIGWRRIEAQDERRAIPLLARYRGTHTGWLNQASKRRRQTSRGGPPWTSLRLVNGVDCGLVRRSLVAVISTP